MRTNQERQEIIACISSHLTVTCAGHGTWRIRSFFASEDGIKDLIDTTHEEEDYTGIFDGHVYNEGVPTIPEICKEQKVNFVSAKKIRDSILLDPANEDNYEPRKQRDLRLAERLYDKYHIDLDF